MFQPASSRETRFAAAAVEVTPLHDGGMHLRSPRELQPYPRRLSDMLCHWAARSPDQLFLAERAGDERAWRRISYAQTLAAVRSIGQALLDRDLSVDRPIAILCDNGVDHALVALAAMHVGVPVAQISPAYSLASKSFAKLRHILDQLNPGLIFVTDAQAFMPALQAVAPSCEIVVAGDRPDGIRVTPLAELRDVWPRADVEEACARVTPDTIAKILFSSGSTDLPKGVITTQRMMCSNQVAVGQVWPFLAERPPVLVDWLPWNHVFGGSFCFNMALFRGGTLFVDDGKPTPRLIGRTVANLAEIAPTIYLNVPLGYDMLLSHLERDAALCERFFARLDVLFYAAATLPAARRLRLEQLALRTRGTAVPIISGWGATETAPLATAVHFATHQGDSIGLPVPGCEIKMVPNNGKLELRVRGPNVTPGYWRRDDLTRQAFDAEGYFRIGDTGRLADPGDPERGIEFVGRIAEDFKLSSGIWVSPGTLRPRAIVAGAPVIQDVVVAGHDRARICLLIVPSEQGSRSLCPDIPDTAPLATVLADPRVRRCVADALAAMTAENDGCSTQPVRALLMREPLSVDANEITDKGYVNQRAVLACRAELVARLYAATPDPEIITMCRPPRVGEA